MNRTTKGALAAGAGAVLLLGGAGSLAFWTSTQDLGSLQGIQSGSFTLSAPNCTTATGAHDWQIDGGASYVPATTLLSPGDTLSKVCDMTLDMAGDHVAADLAIDTAALTDNGATTLDTELAPEAKFTVDGSATTSVTGAGSYAIRATITLTYNGPAATNASQLGNVDLNAINVTATQKHVA